MKLSAYSFCYRLCVARTVADLAREIEMGAGGKSRKRYLIKELH